MYAERLKNFTKLYDELSIIYGNVNVFMDFVKLCAISIYNSFAKNQEMEQEYLKTINTYEKKDQEIFAKMFGELVMIYEEARDIIDVLGPFYEREHLGNKHLGQFFTPTHVSEMLSEITMEDEKTLKEMIEKKGFITMTDPTCGAGRYVTIICKSIRKKKYQLPEGFTYRGNRYFRCMCLYDIYSIITVWNTSCCILWRCFITKNAF